MAKISEGVEYVYWCSCRYFLSLSEKMMVKFWVDTKKGRVIILGLSFADLGRLKAGQFYVFDLLEVGLTSQANILVFADETEEKIEETFGARFVLHKDETEH